jgi:TatD DNase family protein
MFTDSHAHLSSPDLFPHAEELLLRAKERGVDKIVNICTDALSLERGIELSRNYPSVFNTAATTPHDVEKEGESFFPLVERAVSKRQLVAIGETGLDYYYHHSDRKVQQRFLGRYFQLAQTAQLPVVIHCREAFDDLFSMADSEYADAPAVLHCFTGSLDEARRVIDRGWMLSLSGIVTFKKSTVLQEVAQYVPLDRILIETDAPYLAPQSQRGKRNEPSFLPETAAVIAHLKKISVEEVARETSLNAAQFFSFSKLPPTV